MQGVRQGSVNAGTGIKLSSVLFSMSKILHVLTYAELSDEFSGVQVKDPHVALL